MKWATNLMIHKCGMIFSNVKMSICKGERIKNGENVRFWLDPWLYKEPLKDIAPILYKLSMNKLVSVAKVKNGEVSMQFSRWLHGDLAAMWGEHLG